MVSLYTVEELKKYFIQLSNNINIHTCSYKVPGVFIREFPNLEFLKQIFVKVSDIKFREYSSSRSHAYT
jgi:uncharacterized pyridoxamine 5'-phosphate oxidase family protein